jgi:3-methyladenine DNA glycosylase AlkD
MTLNETLKELESYGDERTKRILQNHGAREPLFGVKVEDLKKILKKTKKNHELSIELYRTGNSDAMYLAGLMADENKITKAQLEEWIDQAYWFYLSEFTVPWVASETKFGFELGLEWILSGDERIAAAGWSALGSYAKVNRDENLDIKHYIQLLETVEKNIHTAPVRVRHSMNNFIIAVGVFISELTAKSLEVASNIGIVEVTDRGKPSKLPFAKDYIEKAIKSGQTGKKRKTARC